MENNQVPNKVLRAEAARRRRRGEPTKASAALTFPDNALIRRQAKELREMELMPLADFLKSLLPPKVFSKREIRMSSEQTIIHLTRYEFGDSTSTWCDLWVKPEAASRWWNATTCQTCRAEANKMLKLHAT